MVWLSNLWSIRAWWMMLVEKDMYTSSVKITGRNYRYWSLFMYNYYNSYKRENVLLIEKLMVLGRSERTGRYFRKRLTRKN